MPKRITSIGMVACVVFGLSAVSVSPVSAFTPPLMGSITISRPLSFSAPYFGCTLAMTGSESISFAADDLVVNTMTEVPLTGVVDYDQTLNCGNGYTDHEYKGSYSGSGQMVLDLESLGKVYSLWDDGVSQSATDGLPGMETDTEPVFDIHGNFTGGYTTSPVSSARLLFSFHLMKLTLSNGEILATDPLPSLYEAPVTLAGSIGHKSYQSLDPTHIPSASVSLVVIPQSDVMVGISPSSGAAGDAELYGYSITVSNPGPLAAEDVVVSGNISSADTIVTPAHLGSSNCTRGYSFTCALGEVAVGSTKRIALQVRAEAAVAATTDALSNVSVTTTTPDSDIGHMVATSDITIRPVTAEPGPPPSSPGSFSPVSYQSYCGKPGSGNGEGYMAALLSLQEFGMSGTTHFNLEWKFEERNGSGVWSTASNHTVNSNVFPDDDANYFFAKYHEFPFEYPGAEGTTFRLLIRGKFIQDQTGAPGTVLNDTGWFVVPGTCTGHAGD